MKDVKKLLKESRADVLPDGNIKNNIKAELGFDGREVAVQTAAGNTVALRTKKWVIAACAAVLAVAIALCIIIPSLGDRGGLPGGGFIDGNKFDGITDSTGFYAYGAASVGAVLSSMDGGAAAQGTVRAAASAGIGLSSDSSREESIQTVNRYLALVESLLSDGNITSTAVEGAQGYDYGMTVSYSDLLGESVSYIMYYNAVPLGTQTDGDEREDLYSIEGELIVEGASYPVEGRYTSETEEGEEESELYFKAYTSDDRQSYIEVNRESEEETEDGESESEYKYIYTLYSGGECVERTVVEYESEEGELELKLTIDSGGVREELYFEDETEDGERVISVRGNIDGEAVAFRIYVREGQYHYVFEDGEQDYDRFDRDDDDDDRRRVRLVCV